jgi:hypothetical protein
LADVSLTYRYLSFEQGSSAVVQHLGIQGPMLMVNFTSARKPVRHHPHARFWTISPATAFLQPPSLACSVAQIGDIAEIFAAVDLHDVSDACPQS